MALIESYPVVGDFMGIVNHAVVYEFDRFFLPAAKVFHWIFQVLQLFGLYPRHPPVSKGK